MREKLLNQIDSLVTKCATGASIGYTIGEIMRLIESDRNTSINLAREQGFYAGCGVAGIELSEVPHLYDKYQGLLEMYKSIPDTNEDSNA